MIPQVLGWDFSGTVRAIGAGVTGWVTGDPVLGYSPQPWTGAGAFAEQIAIDAAILTRRPADLAATTAAAFPVSALTADLAVATAAVTASDTVLVLGAAGGLGTLVVQLARAIGAHVIASDSAAAADTLRKLGADAVVDRAGDVPAQIRELGLRPNVLIDLVGPVAWTPVLDVLRPGARFVSSVAKGLPAAQWGFAATSLGVQPDAQRLAQLVAQLTGGQLTIAPTETVTLSAAETALTRVATSDTHGKLVLDPHR